MMQEHRLLHQWEAWGGYLPEGCRGYPVLTKDSKEGKEDREAQHKLFVPQAHVCPMDHRQYQMDQAEIQADLLLHPLTQSLV